jgi:hypothetical protein
LLPGRLSPRLHEGLARLAVWMPFRRAAAELDWFCGAAVGAETARRRTEAAGAALVALETAEAERLAVERPAPPDGPRVQQFSADGALVPLVAGEWAEAKTLALGEVEAARAGDGQPVVRTTGVSYVSRLADAEAFGGLALVETHRRGTQTAGTVAAVADGSEWIQGLVDLHRPDAIRILDFAHAVEHVNAAAQACFGEGAPAAVAWLDQQAAELKDGDPDRVLGALHALPTARAADPAAAARVREATLGYLSKRREQVAYARFRALGLPIGSGMVESANKNVVERRLKGAGMRWARPSVNPMLALRCAVCNDRWDATWPAVAHRLRAAPAPCPTRARRAPGLSAHQASRPRRAPRPPRPRVAPMPADGRPKKVVDGHNTAAHPWSYAAHHPARPGHAAKS